MKKKYIAASLAALCAAGGAMTVHAEDMPVYTLDQVVVTANSEPEKVIDSNADIPSSPPRTLKLTITNPLPML